MLAERSESMQSSPRTLLVRASTRTSTINFRKSSFLIGRFLTHYVSSFVKFANWTKFLVTTAIGTGHGVP